MKFQVEMWFEYVYEHVMDLSHSLLGCAENFSVPSKDNFNFKISKFLISTLKFNFWIQFLCLITYQPLWVNVKDILLEEKKRYYLTPS